MTKIETARARAGSWLRSKRSKRLNFSSASASRRSAWNAPPCGRSSRQWKLGYPGLDPDAIDPTLQDAPKHLFEVRDWKFELTALPVKPESRGKPDHRVLGFGPITAGYVNDVDMLERTLERKRSKYGKPAEPLVFAVLLMSPVDNEDIEGALLGRIAVQIDPDDPEAQGTWIRQRNGFWMKGAEARSTRVSAVITGTSLMPWNVATTWLRLWPNPWAARPLSVELPFPIAAASEQGAFTYEDRDETPAGIFGLPSDWPGPEDRFERI